ncbi:hypothetical protein HDU76_002517 [Blyttiomyces sp. JEL0837]|nr:hypothetical protein HDU76_002517 [Blyttiomyces sp. JEL0837]
MSNNNLNHSVQQPVLAAAAEANDQKIKSTSYSLDLKETPTQNEIVHDSELSSNESTSEDDRFMIRKSSSKRRPDTSKTSVKKEWKKCDRKTTMQDETYKQQLYEKLTGRKQPSRNSSRPIQLPPPPKSFMDQLSVPLQIFLYSIIPILLAFLTAKFLQPVTVQDKSNLSEEWIKESIKMISLGREAKGREYNQGSSTLREKYSTEKDNGVNAVTGDDESTMMHQQRLYHPSGNFTASWMEIVNGRLIVGSPQSSDLSIRDHQIYMWDIDVAEYDNTNNNNNKPKMTYLGHFAFPDGLVSYSIVDQRMFATCDLGIYSLTVNVTDIESGIQPGEEYSYYNHHHHALSITFWNLTDLKKSTSTSNSQHHQLLPRGIIQLPPLLKNVARLRDIDENGHSTSSMRSSLSRSYSIATTTGKAATVLHVNHILQQQQQRQEENNEIKTLSVGSSDTLSDIQGNVIPTRDGSDTFLFLSSERMQVKISQYRLGLGMSTTAKTIPSTKPHQEKTKTATPNTQLQLTRQWTAEITPLGPHVISTSGSKSVHNNLKKMISSRYPNPHQYQYNQNQQSQTQNQQNKESASNFQARMIISNVIGLRDSIYAGFQGVSIVRNPGAGGKPYVTSGIINLKRNKRVIDYVLMKEGTLHSVHLVEGWRGGAGNVSVIRDDDDDDDGNSGFIQKEKLGVTAVAALVNSPIRSQSMLHVWGAEDGNLLRKVEVPGKAGIRPIVFSRDGSRAFVATTDPEDRGVYWVDLC